jgi:hypothetical protein
MNGTGSEVRGMSYPNKQPHCCDWPKKMEKAAPRKVRGKESGERGRGKQGGGTDPFLFCFEKSVGRVKISTRD